MELNDKVVLVTGGGSGIGLGIALALAREGCRVAIAGRNEQRLRSGAAEWEGKPPLLVRPCDVSDRSAVDTLFDDVRRELGPVDILVISAGINVPNRAITELKPDDWDRMMAINTT
ncbi:MAG: SDR family oxidoreductase, partial [Planctomycetota bacterium]